MFPKEFLRLHGGNMDRSGTNASIGSSLEKRSPVWFGDFMKLCEFLTRESSSPEPSIAMAGYEQQKLRHRNGCDSE